MKAKIAKLICAYCGGPTQGNYSIHRDGFGEGPEVPLCDEHGSHPSPSCAEIWEEIARKKENDMKTETLNNNPANMTEAELISLVHEGCTLTDQLTPGIKRLEEIKLLLKQHGNKLYAGRASITLKAEKDEAVLTFPRVYKVNLSLRQVIRMLWSLGNIARQALNIQVTTNEAQVKALQKAAVSEPEKQKILDKLRASISHEVRTNGGGELAPSCNFKRKR